MKLFVAEACCGCGLASAKCAETAIHKGHGLPDAKALVESVGLGFGGRRLDSELVLPPTVTQLQKPAKVDYQTEALQRRAT